MLQDASGNPRLMLKVAPDGGAAIDFLDDTGKVVKTIGPAGRGRVGSGARRDVR